MLGQYVIVLPERDMVLALTSGSPSLFADETCHIVEKYFGDGAKELSDGPLPNDIRALRSLRSAGKFVCDPGNGSKAETRIHLDTYVEACVSGKAGGSYGSSGTAQMERLSVSAGE